MLSPSRRVTSSGMIHIEGETSPVLLINPVFTITANNFNSTCSSNGKRYPKVRQKSKSSGASPQKHPSPNQFHEDFINIITSTDSIDYPEVEFGDEGDYLGIIGGGLSSRSSHGSGRSFHSNPYLHSGYYGSNSKLLQVPCQGGYYEDEADDLSPTRNSRQQRSRSITVPIQHVQKSPERCSSEVFIRRCSSASPKGRYYQQQRQQQQEQQHSHHYQQMPQQKYHHHQNQIIPGLQISPKKQGKHHRERGLSLNAGMITKQLLAGPELTPQIKGKRRRSSGYRRPSINQSIMTAFSSSSSSLGSHSSNSPKRKLSPYNRKRTLSMPTCVQNGKQPISRRNSQKVSGTPTGSDGKDNESEETKSIKTKPKAASYDVVIIGSPNVGKSTLAEYFNKAGTSGSDQGIGSEEDEIDDCVDEDLSSGKAIVYKPIPDLNQQIQHNFTLRIFNQQISAVNHLYKYDAVVILYSVTDRDSFQFARKALEEILPLKNAINNKSNGPINAKKVVILVANKSDLERSRSVSTLEGRSLATAYDCKFIEISSSLDVGIDSLQKGLATQVYLRHHKVLEVKKKGNLISSSMTSSTSSSTSSSFFGFNHQKQQQHSQQRKKKTSAGLSSLRLAQKLIDRIMSIRVTGNGKSKSCLDLHSL